MRRLLLLTSAIVFFDTLFFGTTLSDSVGYHKPVTIYSSSTTDLSARKRLLITQNNLVFPGGFGAGERSAINC